RHPEGLTLRKLAATQLLLLNGRTAKHGELHEGDRLTIGALDIIIHLEETVSATPESAADKKSLQKQIEQFRTQVVRFQEERQAFEQERAAAKTKNGEAASEECEQRAAELERQRQELAGQRQKRGHHHT